MYLGLKCLGLERSLGAFRDTLCVLFRLCRYIGDKRERRLCVHAQRRNSILRCMPARGYIISALEGRAELLGIQVSTVFHEMKRTRGRHSFGN